MHDKMNQNFVHQFAMILLLRDSISLFRISPKIIGWCFECAYFGRSVSDIVLSCWLSSQACHFVAFQPQRRKLRNKTKRNKSKRKIRRESKTRRPDLTKHTFWHIPNVLLVFLTFDALASTYNQELLRCVQQKPMIVNKTKQSVGSICSNLANSLSQESQKPTLQYTAVSGRQFLSCKEAWYVPAAWVFEGNSRPIWIFHGAVWSVYQSGDPWPVACSIDTSAVNLNLVGCKQRSQRNLAAGITDTINILQHCVHKLEYIQKQSK